MSGPTEPTFRANVTDKEQTDIENAEFQNSVAVFVDNKTRVVPKGNGGGAERDIGGVVVPASDKVGSFTEATIGKP
jgi:hypothetical protein